MMKMMMSLILTEAQPRWHSNATIFKCHQRSHIIEDIIEPSCLSEKLMSKHVHLWSWTKLFSQIKIWTQTQPTAWVQHALC